MFTYKGTLDTLVGAATVLTLVEFTALTLISSVGAVGLAVAQSLQLDTAVRHSRTLPLRRVAPVANIICYCLCSQHPSMWVLYFNNYCCQPKHSFTPSSKLLTEWDWRSKLSTGTKYETKELFNRVVKIQQCQRKKILLAHMNKYTRSYLRSSLL